MNVDDPRHATKAGYQAGCREDCCRKAQARYTNQWRMTGPRLVDMTGTRRRVEALATLGWSSDALSVMLGYDRSYLRKMFANSRTGKIRRPTAEKVAALYERLCMTPIDDGAVRFLGWNASREQTRRRAIAHGYAPPLAWDDIDHDTHPSGVGHQPRYRNDNRDTTEYDPVVVDRILSGDWLLPCTPAEKTEVGARWVASGGSTYRLEQLTGWRLSRYYKKGAA